MLCLLLFFTQLISLKLRTSSNMPSVSVSLRFSLLYSSIKYYTSHTVAASYIKNKTTLGNSHILHIATALKAKYSPPYNVHVIGVQIGVLVPMRSQMKQCPRSLARMHLHGGNEQSHDPNQPRKPLNHLGRTASDNHARTALEALNARGLKVLVECRLEQMNEVLVVVEGIGVADVLEVVEAERSRTTIDRTRGTNLQVDEPVQTILPGNVASLRRDESSMARMNGLRTCSQKSRLNPRSVTPEPLTATKFSPESWVRPVLQKYAKRKVRNASRRTSQLMWSILMIL